MQWESEYMRTWEEDKRFLAGIAETYMAVHKKKAAGEPVQIAPDTMRRDREQVKRILHRYQHSETGNPYYAQVAQSVDQLLEQSERTRSVSSAQRATAQSVPMVNSAPSPSIPALPHAAATDLETRVEPRTETGSPDVPQNVVKIDEFKQRRAGQGAPTSAQKQSAPVQEQPVFSSDNAREEYKTKQKSIAAGDEALQDIVVRRLEKTIAFGKTFGVTGLVEYLKRTCGESLYFDSLLSMVQQYALADVPIVNQQGRQIGKTGFHLAFFGAPGTGKTFAINDLIRGNERSGIPAHGLVGRNRYCASMSAVQFLKMGEAYQGAPPFLFIVPEFENWFRYAGMTDIIKLALEGGEIAHETDRGRVGPYRGSWFFAVNYNVAEKGARNATTLQQNPNFQAIEDRMLATVHEQTPDRYRAVAENAERIAMGIVDFDLASQIQDHLMLVYAIQSEHPMVSARFAKKDIVVDASFYTALRAARETVLDQLGKDTVPFSSRLERRALQLAAAMTLPGYFAVGSATPQIEISEAARNYAVRFFVTEAAARSGKDIDVPYVLNSIGVVGTGTAGIATNGTATITAGDGNGILG